MIHKVSNNLTCCKWEQSCFLTEIPLSAFACLEMKLVTYNNPRNQNPLVRSCHPATHGFLLVLQAIWQPSSYGPWGKGRFFSILSIFIEYILCVVFVHLNGKFKEIKMHTMFSSFRLLIGLGFFLKMNRNRITQWVLWPYTHGLHQRPVTA